MKTFRDLFSRPVSETYRKRVLDAASAELKANSQRIDKKQSLRWDFIVAGATASLALYFGYKYGPNKNSPGVENSVISVDLELLQSVDDIDLQTEFELVEELDILAEIIESEDFES